MRVCKRTETEISTLSPQNNADGRKRRAVVDAKGTVFPSLMAAAKVYNSWPARISTLVDLGRDGWRDASESELAALAEARR